MPLFDVLSVRCIVLGAGFSRAVSEQMPLTDELGQAALERLPRRHVSNFPDRPFRGGYFEAWLSRLAEPQPDLRDEENLRNQAAFVEVSKAIRDVLVEAQTSAMASPPPAWLERFLRMTHANRWTVITFNYDTLLEAALNHLYLWDPQTSPPLVEQNDLVDGLPPIPPSNGVVFRKGQRSDSGRLLKLHGSIDCWWSTGDATGATIVRTPGGWGGNPASYARDGAVPGRAPFLVPPAAAKSTFYRNPVSQELWQRAANALGNATAVDFVGYSFPVTDLVTSGMVADRLGWGREVDIQVVNPNPEPPLKHLKTLGVADAKATHDRIDTYVDDLEKRTAERAVDDLTDLPGELPVIVGTFEANLARVTGCHQLPCGLRLVPEAFDGSAHAPRPEMHGGEPPLTVEQIRRELAGRRQLLVPVGADQDARVISWVRRQWPVGYGDGRWLVGVLSQAPPRNE